VKEDLLPPRPGETPPQEEKPKIEGIPFVVYINGKPMEMSKREAMSIMAQIINIMQYLEEQPEVK